MRLLRDVALTLRPPAGDRHGPLVPMMVVLTLLTGLVDAASYLKLGHVFVANMTGNIVFLGFAARRRERAVGRRLVARAGVVSARRVRRRLAGLRATPRTAVACCAPRSPRRRR